jgi:WD40 repeat protein/DNA-binding SARP family transcriptional activator
MAALMLRVLGPFQASLDGQTLSGFRTKKVQALLVYLASEPEPQQREWLLTLLWPGLPETSARANLRQLIYLVRKTIPKVEAGDQDSAGPVIANRQTIQLKPEAVALDTYQFEALIEGTQSHEHVDLLTCHQCRGDLEQAIALYRGDFLTDFYLEDSTEFEAWAQSQREYYRRRALDALEILTTIAIRQQAYPEAREYAEQQLIIDNLRESAYRQLMEILALSGHREEALAQYEACKRVLAEELGMAPSTRTTEIYDKILAGDLSFDVPLAQGVRGYELKEEIGEGAYGSIHRAVQPAINREVAVKVIQRKLANNPEFIRRFEAEAQTIARLEHPYIVPLYDYWRDPDGAYLVMRFLRGGNLLGALSEGSWDPQPALNMMEQIASALNAAHQQGVVHRDIKPANILLDEAGNAFLSDFGIAKDLTGEMQMTAEGLVIGTPDYISPEQIRAEALSPQTDLYSLGLVLYETLTGERPYPDTSVANLLYKHLNEPLPLVGSSRPDLPAAIDEVIQRATAKQPNDRYANALEMAEAFRGAVQGDGALITTGPISATLPAVGEIYNPYKGLRAFQEVDAEDFFGREMLVHQLLERLNAAGSSQRDAVPPGRFLAVVGPSGSGKSSVVKAGLIPALRVGAVPGSEKWFVAEMVPGSHPLEELEMALWPIAVDPPPSLVEPMERDTRGLLRTIRRIMPDEEGAELLLVVDQFEELFTLVEDEERRKFFLDSLLMALRAPRSPLRVVVTLRADFYDRPLQIQPLGQVIQENTEIVLPLAAEELNWAVRDPARRMGVSLEEGLAEAIVADVADQPGALPLVQYAMTELFEMRQDHTMTQIAYREIGGVLGALGKRAEELYAGFGPAKQETSRQLFLRLVALGDGDVDNLTAPDTRRRVLRSELEAMQSTGTDSGEADPAGPTSLSKVIDAYGTARLLTFDHDPVTRGPTVEVAHEALLREWPRLRGWLDQSHNDVRMQRLLGQAAVEWAASEQEPGFLLRDARLDQFAGWAENSTVALTLDEQNYLEASIQARGEREAEEQARRQRELETAQQLAETEHQRAEEQAQAAGQLRRRATFLAGALVVAALLAITAFFFAQQSSRNAAEASDNAALAMTRESEAIANAERADASEAEAIANLNLAVTRQAETEVQRQEAESQRALAQEEAEQRAIAQTEAEQEAKTAFSRELAAAALLNLDDDPERSILLAMEASSIMHTVEAEEALHQAVQTSRIRLSSIAPGDLPTAFVDYSPDGSRIFGSGGPNGGVMWDALTGGVLFTRTVTSIFDYPPDYVTEEWINGADFSPDGSLLILPNEKWAGNEPLTGTITILMADTGGELLTFPAHSGPVQKVTFNPEGTQFSSVGWDSSVKVWDLAATLSARSGIAAATFCCHEEGVMVWAGAFSPDGERLATVSDRMLKMWDIANDRELFSADIRAVSVIFSPDGRYLAVGGLDGSLNILDSEQGETIAFRPGVHGAQIWSIVFGPEGDRLATVGSASAKIWSYADGEIGANPLVLSGSRQTSYGVSFSPDGRHVATGSGDRTLRIWDVTTDGGGEFGLYAHQGRAWEVAFSPDGTWLASVSFDGTAVIWDVANRKVLHTLSGHQGRVLGLAIDPDGRTLATVGDDGTARIWDIQTGEEILLIQAHEVQTSGGFFRGSNRVAYSPSGDRLVTGGGDQTVKVWDSATGLELFNMTGHTDQIIAVAFSPDDRYIASASFDGMIRVWDALDGREIWTFVGDPTNIRNMHFSHDGSRLATGHNSGQVVVWHLPGPEADSAEEPEIALQFQQNDGMVFGVNFSLDDSILSVPGQFRTSLHDATTGEAIIDLNHPSRDAVISPDGRIVATAGNDGLVRLMAVDLEDLLVLAQSRVTRSLTDAECQQYLHLESCPAEE